MDRDSLSGQSGYKGKRKGGKTVPVLCNIVGALILLLVIAATQISTLPRFYGLDAYNMTSSNMEPTIPAGSVVYVRRVAQPDLPLIAGDDLIAVLTDDEGVGFFRVVENRSTEEMFITKSDNYGETGASVPYRSVFGRVYRHYPVLGDIMAITSTTAGKINLVVFAVCGVLLNILAARLRKPRAEE